MIWSRSWLFQRTSGLRSWYQMHSRRKWDTYQSRAHQKVLSTLQLVVVLQYGNGTVECFVRFDYQGPRGTCFYFPLPIFRDNVTPKPYSSQKHVSYTHPPIYCNPSATRRLFFYFMPRCASSVKPFDALFILQHLQLLNDQNIGIKKSVYTILRTSFLCFLQLPISNCARYAFLPTRICEDVDRWAWRSAKPSCNTRIK